VYILYFFHTKYLVLYQDNKQHDILLITYRSSLAGHLHLIPLRRIYLFEYPKRSIKPYQRTPSSHPYIHPPSIHLHMYSTTTTAPIRAASIFPKSGLRVGTLRCCYSSTSPAAAAALRARTFFAYNHSNRQIQKRDSGKRVFSTTPRTRIRDFFPPPETEHIKDLESAWGHPV